jgi:hypothetical protein
MANTSTKPNTIQKTDKSELPLFQQMQYEFAAHIRDPFGASRPEGIEDRRMEIYRDLFFNNANGFLENGFPELRTHYDDDAWRRLVRAFYSKHESHSPYFIDISKEFILYLQDEHEATADDPPYLFELAHFEWAEVALMVDQDEPDWDSIDPHGDMLEAVPVLSPTAYCLAYQWPVHEINEHYQPEEQPEAPSFILIYRNKEDKVTFLPADPVTARIMELLQDETPRTGKVLLTQLAEEMQHPDPEEAIHSGYRILLKLHHADVLLGTAKN